MKQNSQKLRVGTRASALAVTQTQTLVQDLQQLHPQLEVEIIKLTTTGDRIQDRFLADVGGKGLFVKEIEEALLVNQVDVAVHSLKDVPSILPQGLTLAGFPQRRNPKDVLLSSAGYTLENLPQGARVGTVSLRRRAQLQQQRPDLKFEFLRGNLQTRLKKLEAGAFDAIVLARAGLERLGFSLEHAQNLNLVPAPGQGTLGLEFRCEDEKTLNLLRGLEDPETTVLAVAERRVAAALKGDCHLPLGAFAQNKEDMFVLQVFLSLPDGTQAIFLEKTGLKKNWEGVTEDMVQTLTEKGAAEIVERCQNWGALT